MPASLAAILNQQPGVPKRNGGKNSNGRQGPPMLYSSSKQKTGPAAPVRAPVSGSPFGGGEIRPGASSAAGSSGVRFSVRIPTRVESTAPVGMKAQSPPMADFMPGETAMGWSKASTEELPRLATPSSDRSSSRSLERHSKRRFAAGSGKENLSFLLELLMLQYVTTLKQS